MKWHSVLRRMPDSEVNVLIHCPASPDPVAVAHFASKFQRWIYQRGSIVDYIVTHWAELPPPPEAKP